RKNARRSSIATACRPISMSGLLVTNGSLSGLATQPIELTVSQTPTNQGLQLVRDIVYLNEFARSKYSCFASSSLLLPGLTRSIANIIRITYGTSDSFKGRMSPYMCSSEKTARTVYAPLLKPNNKILSTSEYTCMRKLYACVISSERP